MNANRHIGIFGAPLAQWAPRLLLAALLAFAPGLAAEGPAAPGANQLQRAKDALREGKPEALAESVKALKQNPLAAAENLQVALALFQAAQFDDAARHLRRALAADPDALKDEPKLETRMPSADLAARINSLAPKVVDNAELCFLAGVIVLLQGDRARAIPLLVRAEELAGTDAQASALGARLASTPFSDRNRERAVSALRGGAYDDAARCFAFAALDHPTVAEHYAGAAVAHSLVADLPVALRMHELMLARARFERLLPWLRDLNVAPGAAFRATAAARAPAVKSATLGELRLAATVAISGGLFATARDALLAALMLDKLDTFAHESMRFLEQHALVNDPPGLGADPPVQPDTPPVEPEKLPPPVNALEEARKLIRRLEFTEALKLLDPLVSTDQKDHAALLLVFVACVGRVEPQPAADALEAWFTKAADAERTRLNMLRELFDRAEHFAQWRKVILTLREADPNAALPRLLNAFVELTAGAYTSARQEVQVAMIGSPENETLKAMSRILARDEFQRDAAPPVVTDRPTAKTLLGQADTLFRRGEYTAAQEELLKALETNPKEPRLAEALVRVYFALGDYSRAARQVEALLAEQKIAERTAADFSFSMDAGYDRKGDCDRHLDALKLAASERTSAADENLVLGVILYSRGQWKDAATALNEWKSLSRARELNPAVLKLLEAASKKG